MTHFEISLLGGALYGFGFMPPLPHSLNTLSFFFRLIVAIIGFLQFINVQRHSLRVLSSFVSGFAFGFGFIFISFFGIYHAFSVVKQLSLFLPCLIFLSAFIGSLLGGLMAFCRWFLNRITPQTFLDVPEGRPVFPSFAFGFSVSWFLFELIRGCCLGPVSLPWNLTGHLFCFENLWIAQIFTLMSRLFGIYVLSWIFSFTLSSFFEKKSRELQMSSLITLGGIVLFSVPICVNVSRENNSMQRGVRLLMIQPNIAQQDKLLRGRAEKNLQKLELLTYEALSKVEQKPDIIVWPETAINGLLSIGSPLFERLKKLLPNDRTLLIFGADRILIPNDTSHSLRWCNSLFVLSKRNCEAIYDKVHLLPFGEYVPFRSFFSTFFNKVLGGIDCTPGENLGVVKLSDFPSFLVKICSETMFYLLSSSHKRGQPPFLFKKNVSRETSMWDDVKFILSIANDGWFASPILWQHLAVDRLRAIESGLPLIRTTNNGITSYIASDGGVIDSLPIQQDGFLEVVVQF